jgi:hypothetical protein
MRNGSGIITRIFHITAVVVGVVLPLETPVLTRAADVLVADRLTDSVYRYSPSGTFLNVVLVERDEVPADDFIDQPTGLALSPDAAKLYVSSSQTNKVIRYDYDALTGLASNASVFADAADALQFPNAITFSPAGDKIYVSSLGGTGVAQFNVDGSSAGGPLGAAGELAGGATGLDWTPSGELLVGSFADLPAGTTGSFFKSNPAVTSVAAFIGPSTSLAGASGVLVHGDYVYATGMFASSLRRFNLAEGSPDPDFNVGGLAFPQGLMEAPDGNGMLAGILGYANGAGHIAHYDFDGNLVGDGVFASPGGGGFSEATAFVTVRVTGDFNDDLLVNGDDLAVWATNFGDRSGQATLAMGDADANGDVDGNDFLIWQRNVSVAPNPETQSAPEPGSAGLATIALWGPAMGMAPRRQNRWRRRSRRCHVPIVAELEAYA